MAFPAQFSGKCANGCKVPIEPGQMVKFNRLDAIVHDDCNDIQTVATEVETYALPTTHTTVIAEDDEEVIIAPVRYGICPSCHMEMPATRVCGYC